MKSFKSLLSIVSLVVAATVFTGCLPAGYTTGKAKGKAKCPISESFISGYGHSDPATVINSPIEIEMDIRVLNTDIPPTASVTDFPPNCEGLVEVEDEVLDFVFNGYALWAGIYASEVDPGSVAAAIESALSTQSPLSPLSSVPAFASAGATLNPAPTAHELADKLKTGKAKLNKAVIAYGYGRTGEELHGKDKLGPVDQWECPSEFALFVLEMAQPLDLGSLSLPAGSTLQLFITEGNCGVYGEIGLSDKTKIRIDLDKKPRKP